MKTRDSGGLPCPECGSPLVPCKCERERKRGMISRFGSTLRANPKKRMKARTLREKFKDRPWKYGQVFEAVRKLPCAGRVYVPGHECGPGVAPASAHHLGRDDLDGLVPACARFHDDLEERVAKVTEALRTAGNPSLEAIGKSYVGHALFWLNEQGELDPVILEEAKRRGYRAEVGG